MANLDFDIDEDTYTRLLAKAEELSRNPLVRDLGLTIDIEQAAVWCIRQGLRTEAAPAPTVGPVSAPTSTPVSAPAGQATSQTATSERRHVPPPVDAPTYGPDDIMPAPESWELTPPDARLPPVDAAVRDSYAAHGWQRYTGYGASGRTLTVFWAPTLSSQTLEAPFGGAVPVDLDELGVCHVIYGPMPPEFNG